MPLTTFLGRTAEVATVVALLDRSRVVTLTGPPGIGKTRLAVAAAARSRRHVFFCDLSSATDATDVVRLVGDALGVDSPSQGSEAVSARLRALGEACLVVDHCEHVRAHVASAIRRWHSVAGETSYLVTSRSLLQTEGEQAYEVPALPEEDACALFADRARLSRHDFDARADGEVIAAIVRKLDGIPLAIELAAARMAVMSASTLLSKLDDAFAVLDRTDRERTLQRTIEAMCAMLSAAERSALGRLATFRAGFTLETAGALVPQDTADVLQSLLERSLLRARGGARFAMYEIIRQYALAHLVTDEEREAAREAHTRVFVDGAARWLAPGPDQLGQRRLMEMALDGEEVRAVYERLVAEESPRKDALLPIALAWHSLLYARGELGRAREVLDATLAKGDSPLALVFRVLHQRARMTHLEAARARADCERARELAARAGDARVEALSVCALGYIAVQVGDDAAIAQLLPEAIEMQRACGDLEGEMRTHRLVGTVLVNQGRATESMRHFERARDIARRVDAPSVAVYSGMIGCVHLGAGRVEAAERSLREAALHIGVDDHLEGAHFAAYLAVALQELGRFDEAGALYERAARTSQRQGDTRQLPITLHYWATLAHETGDLETAIARYRDALGYYAEGTREIATCTHAALGAALAQAGRLADAKAALSDAMHACRELGAVWKTVAAVHGLHIRLCGKDAASVRVPETPESNEDVRFAVRLLEKQREQVSCALVIGPRAAWFRVRSRPAVSLERRKLLRALLEALATQPAISSEALIARLWPEEQVSRRAGLNRVHVAIAQLRGLGLEDHIEQKEGSYKLKGGVRFERDPDPRRPA